MATSPRILKTTRERWVKELSDETVEHHPMLKVLQEKKRIKYSFSGEKLKWTVKYKQLELSPYADMQQLEFARKDLFKTAELDWRGYKVTDAISEFEKLQNKGEEAVIKLFANKLESMKEDANDQIPAQFYVDGNATGNESRFHGIESFMGITTGSQSATDPYATVYTDTYAGLVTTEGNYGGSSASDRHWNFWTPTIVNTNPTGQTWAANADEMIRRAVLESKRSLNKTHRLDLIVLSRSAYMDLMNLLDGKERVVLNNSTTGMAKYGFEDMVTLDGVDVTFDPDMPTTDANSDVVSGYGFNTSQMELCLLGDKQLWSASGDAFNETDMSFRFWVGLYGNLKFNSPRHFVKFAAVV